MWVARQKNGDLYMFTINEPYRHNGYWENDVELESNYTRLDNSLFPKLTWEDEPIEVSIVPKPETKVFDDYWTWEQTKCQQCKFFDGYDVCCKNGNFGTITTERLNNCVIKHLFEKKD